MLPSHVSLRFNLYSPRYIVKLWRFRVKTNHIHFSYSLYSFFGNHPPSPLSRPIFSEADAYVMHFPHNDALVATMHISCCRVSKILIDGGSSINILYGHALDRMEDILELARKMILIQTQSLLYGFDRSEAHSPVVTKFCIFDIKFSYNAVLDRPWIHMMRAVSSTHHQLLKYPIPSGMTDIRVDQAMTRNMAAIARKKSDWMTKTSRAVSDKDSLMDKKQKIITDQ